MSRAAIVTGAAAGIGLASAIEFAGRGYDVALADIDADALAAAKSLVEAQRPGTVAIAVATDIADAAAVADLVARAERDLGMIRVLHANAGIGIYANLELMPVEVITRLIVVNLTGALLCARAVIEPMRRAGGGAIVFTSSIQATTSLPGCVAYSATKAGIIAAARTLSVEVGGDNIRVNCVSPGTIETAMLARDLAGMDVENSGGQAAFRQRVEAANALGRIGSAAEVAQAVAFLASDEASYITGANLAVDAGFSAVKAF